MKIRFLALPAMLTLAACASTPSYTDRAPRTPPTWETDGSYVAMVEAQARRHGVAVVWVNMPTKRAVARHN